MIKEKINMKKKIIIMALVFSLALVSLSGATQGEINDLQGYFVDSHDEHARFYDGDEYYANITAVAMGSEMIATNHGTGGGYFEDFGLGSYSWDAGTETHGWHPDPAPQGDDVFFISEHEDGYVWAVRRDNAGATHADPMNDMWGQYEPIPQPEVIGVGPDYIEIQIDAPSYTCYSDDTGTTYNQGTFELLDSYAVFAIGGDYTEWTHIGNTEDANFTAGPDDPIIPRDENPDPDTRDTGHFTFNATGLDPETEYNFMVRMNFDFDGFEGGYGGGLGSYTTWQSGASLDDAQPTEPASEFGPGLMIPVVATVGIFVAITVYRRKKFE